MNSLRGYLSPAQRWTALSACVLVGFAGCSNSGAPDSGSVLDEPDPLGDPNGLVEKTAPAIFDVEVDVDHFGNATISWSTDQLADSQVHYGRESGAQDEEELAADMVHEHSVQLSGLELDTHYSYRVASINGTGLRSDGPVGTFFTDSGVTGPGEVTTRRELWYPLELSFTGPSATEWDEPTNPFLDYRLSVLFTSPRDRKVRVPGFFDGDGAGKGDGNVWKVRWLPDEPGIWRYRVDFHKGNEIALDLNHQNGTPVAPHGEKGGVPVQNLQPGAEGFFAKGPLMHAGEHYFQFRNGEYFLKAGVNSPENFFGYKGFDNTFDQPGGASTSGLDDGLHLFQQHRQHWGPNGLGDEDDPYFVSEDWGISSKGIIGSLNYLSSVGINSIYFLPMNMGGDGRETVPFVGYNKDSYDKTHYDVSKLHQWNQVIQHTQKRGIMVHMVLGETESGNEKWLDNGTLGTERMLFYREMIARFGYANALQWNLSEENDYSNKNLALFANYIRALDPLQHPITFHTHLLPQSGHNGQYQHFMGDRRFAAGSLQTAPHLAGAHVEKWREASADADHPWIIGVDELSPAGTGLTDWNADQLRREALYDTYFSGGNIEWYLGYHNLPLGGDLRLEDFSTRQEMWTYMSYAAEFLRDLPFWDMQPADHLVTDENGALGGAEVFAKIGEYYAIYYPDATKTGKVNLTGLSGTFKQRWYNPRTGMFEGATKTINAGSKVNIGAPPNNGGGSTKIFIEKNKLVVMEIEHSPPNGDWSPKTQYPGYTGSNYYQWTGPNHWTDPGNGILQYPFEVTNAGTYQFRIHNRHNHPEPDQENDCWVRIDGGDWVKLYSNKGKGIIGKWNWESRLEHHNGQHTDPSYQLGPGVHVFQISGRSKNFMIDRVHFYQSSVPNPKDKTLPQSKTKNGSLGEDDDWVVLLKR